MQRAEQAPELVRVVGLDAAGEQEVLPVVVGPWRAGVLAAVAMIDDLDREIAQIDRELKALGGDHRYIRC